MDVKVFVYCVFSTLMVSCREKPVTEPVPPSTAEQMLKPLPGRDNPIDSVDVQKGKVLVAYSDCYMCHSLDKRAKGPSFKEIAHRYPATEGYINLLSRKIIVGGRGIWGNAVMEPHPDVRDEDAAAMAKFILSLND